MTDRQTLDVYAERAADYADNFASDGPDRHLREFIALVPQGGKVLDLGCGPAAASVHMRAAGLDPDPIDASPEMVALANERFKIGARLGSFDDIEGTEKYAGIWANFSLLHAPREKLPIHFAAISQALVQGGIMHIGMKTGQGTRRDALGRSYTYVSVDELAQLLLTAGLVPNYTHEGAEAGLAGTIDPFVIMRAKKDPNA